MTPRRATATDVVAAARPLLDGSTRFLGIDGFGTSGKSTLAAYVSRALPGVAVVHTDDLQPPGVTQWDWTTLNTLVAPLLAGDDVTYPLWSWGDPTPSGTATVAAGTLVIVEGVSATRAEALVPWDLTVWVEAPEPVRRSRALERDGPDLEQVWRTAWIPPEEAYAARERPWERVDLVVDGTAGPDDLGQSTPS